MPHIGIFSQSDLRAVTKAAAPSSVPILCVNNPEIVLTSAGRNCEGATR
jgi:hypothetical protein